MTEVPSSNFGKYERKPDPEHAKWAQALKRRPYEWVMVRECPSVASASQLARRIKRGEAVAFRDGVYEASISQLEGRPNSVRGVWARYCGSK